MKHIHKIYDKPAKNHTSCILLYSKPLYRAKFLGPKCLHLTNGFTLLEEQIKELHKTFEEKEIVVCTGFEWQKIYKEKNNSVRLIDNPAFEESSDIEEIRLGILNCPYSNKFIFLTDDFVVTKKNLVKLFNESSLVVSEDVNFEYKLNTEDGLVKKVGFSGELNFTGAFSLVEKEFDLALKFLLNEYKKSKILIEMIDYIISNGGNFKTIDKVIQ